MNNKEIQNDKNLVSTLLKNIFNQKFIENLQNIRLEKYKIIETNVLPTDCILQTEQKVRSVILEYGIIEKISAKSEKIAIISKRFGPVSKIFSKLENLHLEYFSEYTNESFDDYSVVITDKTDHEYKRKIINTRHDVSFVLDQQIVSESFIYHLHFIKHKIVDFNYVSTRDLFKIILNEKKISNINGSNKKYTLNNFFKINSKNKIIYNPSKINMRLLEFFEFNNLRTSLDDLYLFKNILNVVTEIKKQNFIPLLKKIYNVNPQDIGKKIVFLTQFISFNKMMFPDQDSIIKQLSEVHPQIDKSKDNLNNESDFNTFLKVNLPSRFMFTPENVEYIAKLNNIKVSDFMFKDNLSNDHNFLSEYAYIFMKNRKPMSDFLTLILYFSKKDFFDNKQNLDFRYPNGLLLQIFIHTRVPEISVHFSKYYNSSLCNHFLFSFLFPSFEKNICLQSTNHDILISFFLNKIKDIKWISSPTNISRILFFCKYFKLDDCYKFFNNLTSLEYYDKYAIDYFYQKYFEFIE